MAKSGQWMWINHGQAKTSTTHIDNLVHAIDLALTQGDGGQAYFILDDGVRTMKEIISAIAATREIALPDKSVPSWAADALAGVAEGAWRTFNMKGEPLVTRFGAMIMSRDSVLIDAKARRDVGYAPVISVEEGLRQLSA
jgi:nucleoside-diphosphate-sugar epimerase